MGDEIRKLAAQLAESSRKKEGVRLDPRSVIVALSALRAYVERRSKLEVDASAETFRVELADDQGAPPQILATAQDPLIARAALDEAEKRRPDAKVLLRGGSDNVQHQRDPIGLVSLKAGGPLRSSGLASTFAKSR